MPQSSTPSEKFLAALDIVSLLKPITVNVPITLSPGDWLSVCQVAREERCSIGEILSNYIMSDDMMDRINELQGR